MEYAQYWRSATDVIAVPNKKLPGQRICFNDDWYCAICGNWVKDSDLVC